jgi:hypothetical protein
MRSNPKDFKTSPTRRAVLLSAAAFLLVPRVNAAEDQVVTVYKDLRCGCCTIWMRHLEKNGFVTRAMNITNVDAIKSQFGVPSKLATCHTAQVGGYVIEGHVPAAAIERLLLERPNATGLGVPGMPAGAPGMESGRPEQYEVVLFGPSERRIYMSFFGEQQLWV